MNVTRRPSKLEDADLIVADLSGITASELSAIGVNRDFAALFLEELILKSDASSYFDEDGNILCIFGFITDDRHISSWFAATETVFKSGVSGVFATRRAAREAQARFPGKPLESVSHGKHPEAPRWFKALGYVPIEVNNSFTRYRFKNTG